ncbi:RHS repeat domain-containing protein [Aquimarina sp. LLG6339-5]|uniref:RHS repeat domain-containing protein n=1 Tax=Aquimarina sp. LLG6339-5 TaxID=3160830 RepID=UPI003862D575
MRKAKNIIIIIVALIALQSVAQELPVIIQPSPETAALLKFVNTPVNYSNGLPSIQIPFYTIKTRSGLNVPIYISYHASGIKVNEHATQVGLGWKLSVGGMISNQSYGETDDHTFRRYPNFDGDFISSLSRFNPITRGDWGDIYCASPEDRTLSYLYALGVTGFGIENGIPKMGDALPDIYYYETPVESGKFVYDSDFNAHPIPYAPLSIERRQGNVVILDQQGNTFNYDNVSFYTTEPNLSYDPNSNSFREQAKLSKIVTPLKETISYTYSTEDYSYLNPETFIDYTRIPNAGCGDKTYYDTPITTHFTNQRLDKIEFDTGYVEFYYSDQEAYKIENSTVRKDLPGASALRRVVVYNNQNVIIKDFELIYSYFESLAGVSSDPDKYRLKLDRVIERGELPYEFIYTGDGVIPHRLSTQQDYWGYFGGSGGLLPSVRFQDIEISGSDRSVDESLLKIGTLEKIEYPTGGNTSFFFNEVTYTHPQTENSIEQNRTPLFNSIGTHSFLFPVDDTNNWKIYFFNECGDTTGGISEDYCVFSLYDQSGNRIAQNSVPGVYEISGGQLAGTTGTVILEGNPSQTCNYGIYIEGESLQEEMVEKKTQLPGLRLDRIVVEPLIGLPVTTTFDYKIPGSNRISKDVTIPRFHYLERRLTNNGENHQGTSMNCHYVVRKGIPVYSEMSSYEYVREQSAGNGYTQYHFTPSRSGSDNSSALSISIENADSGKLLSKEVYLESNKILYKEEHTYETDYTVNQVSSDYRPNSPSALTLGISFDNIGSWLETCLTGAIVSDSPSPRYLLEYNIFNINSGWVKNKQSINTNYYYDANNILSGTAVTTTDYFYGSSKHAQVVRTEVATNTGEVVKTQTYYPDDVEELTGLTFTQKEAIKRMQKDDLHQIAIPIQIVSWKKEGTTDKKPTTQRTLFQDFGDAIVLPNVVQTAKDDDPLENRLQYYDYDDQGNPLEVSKTDGAHISYIWGYNKQYPVAKVENATRAEIEALSGFGADFHTGEGGLSDTQEGTLRTSLPNAMISTYVYQPLIGITSMTDPRGYTMTYHYDDLNRLEFVKDADGNLVSENQYNYKN